MITNGIQFKKEDGTTEVIDFGAIAKNIIFTNGKTLEDIVEALSSKIFTEIPDDGRDLDDYVETGVYYYCSPLVGETSNLNSPYDAFVMFVFPVRRGLSLMQLLFGVYPRYNSERTWPVTVQARVTNFYDSGNPTGDFSPWFSLELGEMSRY